MKSIRTKLFATVAMLMVAIVMMSSASYAWFTISTNPEVKDLTATVVVNENLEIAYRNSATAPGAPAAGDSFKKATAYGNLVGVTGFDTGDAFVTDYKDLDKTLRPATLVSGAFKAPSYGTDGRVDQLVALKLSGETGVGNIIDDDGKIYGYYIDLYIRTNIAGKVSLDEDGSKRSTAGTVTGGGSKFTADNSGTADAQKDLAKNIAVAFSYDGGTITAFNGSTSGNTAKSFYGDITSSMTANVDHTLRIFVFLEGANVKNASASIKNGTVSGKLNLQFKNAAITLGSMDAQS